jgi:hypothetical protein
MDEVLHSLGFRLASDPIFFVPYLLLLGSIAIALLRRTPFLASRRLNRYLWVLYPLLAIAVAGLFLALGPPMTYYVAHSDVEHPLEADFGGQVRLLGYTLSNPIVRPGSIVRLTLYWCATAHVDRDYSLFVHVLHQGWTLVTQSDHLVGGSYPSSLWLPGEVVVETTYLHIPSTITPGEYPIAIGLYQWQTGERLPALVEGQRLDADVLFLPERIVVVER